jgi:multiple sugar transport system ATP-binding protein
MPHIEIRDVSLVYDTPAGRVTGVQGASFNIEQSEFVCIVGPSGCGKSTLLNIIAGLDTASQGTIEIGGRPMNGVAAKDRDIAMVFQTYALYPSMTVRQNMTFGMECRRVPKHLRVEAVDRVAKLLQIVTLLDRKPSQLSGGQRQRVAMGRALVRDPLLFLFDEPLSNLDAKLRVEMRMEIKRLHQRLGSTMVYVTHDQIEAMTLATRIAVMNQGEIQQFADPDTVYNRPANLFVARFMGAPPMNTLHARLVVDDGRLYAELRDGAIRLPLPLTRNAGDYVDREVVLGIRPECIAEHNRRFEDGSMLVEAPVEMTEPTGAETIVPLRLGGHEVLGRVAPDIKLKPGEIARFALDTRKICLFDPVTERLVT